jgi:DNA-binding MarR family transcriptional regulator
MRPSEIAEWTQTERHNITALINRMTKEGLVEAKRDSCNKRYVNVALTDKGWEALILAMPVARETVNQIMLSISESDAVLLEKSLRILRGNAQHGLEHLDKQA